ncbi:MAG: right-handed parallel beta-helix repeat-containing protein, partial [Proteobacteria bacterium]|nr:right-handed parallel beta-helix repeat-containing protein [Pseudomonadota bacterium]
NEIHHYWKGIGSFGESRVGVYHNYVHDLRGWGIVATGKSDMVARNNTVLRCGNVGIAGWSEDARIEIVNNIIADNGKVEKWVAPRVGIWMNCLEGNYRIAYNLFYNNHDCDVAFGFLETDDGWTYESEREFMGIDGNLKTITYYVDSDQDEEVPPVWKDKGDPQYVDLDGTRSDIGADSTLIQNSFEDMKRRLYRF